MNHPETALQTAAKRALDAYERAGVLYWAPVPNGMHIAGKTGQDRARRMTIAKAQGFVKPGAPDITICIRGRYVAVELKAEKGVLSDSQKYTRDIVTLNGGLFTVVRTIDELHELVATLKGPAPNKMPARHHAFDDAVGL